MRKGIRIALFLIGIVLIVLAAGFILWAETPAGAMPEAQAALQSDPEVKVERDGQWIVFTPAESQPTTGLIFYPGGRVDPRAYAPAARQIAAEGYLVAIVPMPLNLAIFGANAAADVMEAYPEIENWAVGGHSLGGAMAASFAKDHSDEISGLALWAAYPASSADLSGSGLDVVSVYGTLDGLATGDKIEASRALLPADTTWAPIAGGNHAQFGWYGDQAGDNPAAISRNEQQNQIVAATLALLKRIQ